jgi:hypothetical protein
MPELPRDLPHLYLRGRGTPEPYTTKTWGAALSCLNASGPRTRKRYETP